MQYLIYGIVLSIPISLRKLVYVIDPTSMQYGSIFLYGSDLLLILLVIANARFLWHVIKTAFKKYGIMALVILLFLIATASIIVSSNKILSAYTLLRLGLYIVFTFYYTIDRPVNSVVLQLFAATAVGESILALFQFSYQHSFGFWFLGEPTLNPFISGIAKIAVPGGALLRPYGTFLHPNILGAFLVLGLFSLIYFRIKIGGDIAKIDRLQKGLWQKIFYDIMLGVAIFVVLFGLVLTFSRSAWISFGIVFLISMLYLMIYKSEYRRAAASLFVLVVVSTGLIYHATEYFINRRLDISAQNPSVSLRVVYDKIGLYIIGSHPFFGVGIGNQVLYGAQNGIYKLFGLGKSWQIEPVHNLYILIASEIGILGLVIFLVFVATIIWQNIKNKLTLERLIGLAMLLVVLILGTADHYFWTIEQGQLMLWVVLGLSSFNG